MQIIPAIDLKNGKCVRLRQGRDATTTEYSADPVAVAARWAEEGARRLHVVNLDGAFGRSSDHLEILREIVRQTGVAVQFGGGLRSLEAMWEALNAGASKVVLGTFALEDSSVLPGILEELGPGRCIIALDTVEGKITTRGWTNVTDMEVVAVAARLADLGVQEILQTDVARDGMMTGPDLQTLSELCTIGIDVLASGGISSAADVVDLIRLKHANLTGVIIGRALYERAIDLRSLILSLGSDVQAIDPKP
jgi:phosphoribosylformimino-5-aminoimidazole carboxamide ribotide isomerase